MSEYPEALLEKVAAAIPTPEVSKYVQDWPEAEQRMYREGDWRSFTEREEALSYLRRRTAAVAVLDALGVEVQWGAVWAPGVIDAAPTRADAGQYVAERRGEGPIVSRVVSKWMEDS